MVESEEESSSSEEEETSSDGEGAVKKTTINQLPREVLMKIFSYFSLKDLSCRISFVCWEWYILAHDPLLWGRLVFSFTQKSGRSKDIITKVPLLKSLSIVARKDVGEIIELVCKHCPQLRHIEVAFCGSLIEEDLCTIVNTCEHLQSLSLKGSIIKDVTPFCYEYLTSLQKLQSLNLSLSKNLEGYHLRLFANTLLALKEFHIGGITHFNDDDMVYFIENKKDTLTDFRFDATNLTDTTFCALGCLRKLVRLAVTMAQKVTDVGFASIVSLEHLKHLEFQFSLDVSHKAFIKLFDKPSAKKLEYIDLSWCTLVNDSVILTISRNCPLLGHLELRHCLGVTDIGISAIVKSCNRLEFLDLLGVDQITGSALTEIPAKLKNLTYLNLRQCSSVEDEILEEIVFQLPFLVVYNKSNAMVF